MKLCIYCKYKVKYKCSLLYCNEDGDWVDKEIKWTKIMEGGEFSDLICNLLDHPDFGEINSTDSLIYISYFDPMSGESSDYHIEYEEIKESKNETR